MIANGLNWWIEGLAAALLAVLGSFRRARRFRLDTQAKPLVLRPADAADAEPIPVTGGNLSPAILQQTQGSRIEIVVPKAAILAKRLDPMPSESRPYVENVVQHQMETLFPWRAGDAIVATDIASRDDDRIDVTVRATPKFAVSQAIAAARSMGAGEIVIMGEGEPETNAIPVIDGQDDKARKARAQFIARYAIVGLMLFALVVTGWTSFSRWSLEGDIAALDETISDRRAVLRRASDPRGKGDGIQARKQNSVIATIVLEALSNVLPDDTYLTDMSLDAARLRITGVSPRATDIVPMLEGSGHFTNASFYAPTTRMPGRNTDRFSIEASVVPKLQVTP